ncbi:thioredoxin domain-containing protein [Candidatus Marinamargulisbacteria bacterium SCGC AG-343-D04]|nr:thioredoxin domain-containing protein [Candidatus Marinamargulisbacteria bacterium SCGC AG-343-D04]
MNRLSEESSPYLLQHTDNPVHWYAWSEEAFEEAKKQDKPIFLSIGYSTCHWCHVMAHESFENSVVANLMNEAFINIKVDREERPDIDQLYMTVCQMMTGAGGWPLTIVMTPDKEPFFAGTYFPVNSSPHRIGMKDLIVSLSEAWNEKRGVVINETQKIVRSLQLVSKDSCEEVSKDVFDNAFHAFVSHYDKEYGGFSKAPKFPSSHQLDFLMAYYQSTGKEDAINMVTHTLDAMFLGGIYDQVGYGFHRYSTDQEWHLPHFEKMLYDQAQLIMTYSTAYHITKNKQYKDCVNQCVSYISERLLHSEGGGFSAEDADSEGEEGTFYIWKYSELERLLNKEEFDYVVKTFKITKEGNFIDEGSRKTIGENILNPEYSLVDDKLWESIRQRLKVEREKRVAPGLDDKILTDWNGLLIAGLAKAGQALNNDSYIQKAKDIVLFIEKYLEKNDKLYHRFREGKSGIEATMFDYHFYVYGLIELYQVSNNERYLKKALKYNEAAAKLFWDTDKKGYFISQSKDLLVKQKDSYDGAIPAGNAVGFFNDLKLSHITHDAERFVRAKEGIERVAGDMNRYPMGYTFWLKAYVDLNNGLPTLVITEDLTIDQQVEIDKFTGILIQYMNTPYLKTVLTTKGFKSINDQATFYYCHNFVCEKPTSDFDQIISLLESKHH